jgi:flagellar hook-associated protein FlgK
MNAFPIGISALSAANRALDLIGQNIANASTPGYTRQAVNLASVTYDGVHGVGVSVTTITRYSAPSVRTAILAGNADSAYSSARLDTRKQVESLLAAGSGGLTGGIDAFFDKAEALSATPADAAARRDLVASAADAAGRFRAAADGIGQLRTDVRADITQSVKDLNSLASQVADLNVRIATTEAGGGQANDLRDRRDSLVDNISKLTDVRVIEQPDGVNVIAAGAAVVVGQRANTFATAFNPDGTLAITQAGSSQPVLAGSGKIGGLLQEHNVELPATLGRLDGLAREFVRGVNQVQASGLGTGGPVTSLVGSQSVADPTAPLATQNLPIPVQAGQLVVSVTDASTGQRTNGTVAIDPATQSLNDVAAAITAATGGKVQGSVDATTNTLKLNAQPGFAFDFAGRTANPPVGGTGGTSTPQVGGVYTGKTNDTYSFQLSGSGTVGVTPGLSLQVKDGANNLLATLNVGAGYAAGTPLSVGNGVTVQLAPGTAGGGTFTAPLLAYPADSAGALPALGVGGLFDGTSASSIAVRPAVQADPGLLATSRSGQPGDASNLVQLAAVRDRQAFGPRTLTAEGADIAGGVGADVKLLDDQQTATDGVMKNLSAQEQSVAGVDLNEELVKLADFQRMIEGASKYMSAVNTALDAVMDIIR